MLTQQEYMMLVQILQRAPINSAEQYWLESILPKLAPPSLEAPKEEKKA